METNNDSFVYSDEFYWEKRWKVNSIEFHKTDNNPFAHNFGFKMILTLLNDS